MSKLTKQLKAFTLIEMTVSISIIVIVTALFIANFRTTNKRTDLTMTVQSLVADLHAAQNNTLGLLKYNNSLPAGGWGINLKVGRNTYTTFADLDAPNASGYMVLNDGEADIEYGARLTTLPAGMQIVALKFGPALTPISEVNVTFLPPDPRTNIYNVDTSATSSSLLIEVKEASSDIIKTIRVNFLGLIEVVEP